MYENLSSWVCIGGLWSYRCKKKLISFLEATNIEQCPTFTWKIMLMHMADAPSTSSSTALFFSLTPLTLLYLLFHTLCPLKHCSAHWRSWLEDISRNTSTTKRKDKTLKFWNTLFSILKQDLTPNLIEKELTLVLKMWTWLLYWFYISIPLSFSTPKQKVWDIMILKTLEFFCSLRFFNILLHSCVLYFVYFVYRSLVWICSFCVKLNM